MCGIAGASLNPTEPIDATALATQMLLGIEDRGRHATGTAWLSDDGQTWVSKAAIPASTYVQGEHVPATAPTFIGHTRWATQGKAANNDNNHPVDVGGIVGIHNGVIYNDDELFDLIGANKRIAQVDTEAIFATLLHSGLPATDSLALLRGSAAVAWYDAEDARILHLARVSYSPLVLGRTLGGSLLFASTRSALTRGAAGVGTTLTKVWEEDEGVYLRVLDGNIIERISFGKQERRALTDVERRALSVA
jgi:glucosamine 6-phosphate synthetase-like amidotransferase/phosphosugar isomerase protein